MPHPSTPIQRFRFQQNFKGSENRPLTSPRSPMGINSKLNIDPKNVDCLQLCMDVPFPDHPYLIGPRGRKSQYFMTRYKSLLHFPDANCRTDGLKLNNVLISGTMKNVEEIRAQIRLRTPIRVIVQLSQFSNVKQLINRVEEAISQRSLPIRFNVSEDLKTAVLKTEWRNEELLVDFADEFLNNTKQMRANREELFTLGIALLPLINPWNHELSHRLIGSFYEQTGCRIFYPPKDKYAVQPPTYFIKGASMLGVLKATKYLMGLTMLQITFYLPPGTMPSIKQHQLDDWQRDHLVHTTIYNPEQNSPVPQFKIVLRSFEFSINGLYFVRSTLLGFKKSIQTSCYDFMKSTKYLIPYTVFMDAKLYYPLYSVDNKNLNWNCHEFFNHFYGSPYSKQYEQQQQFDKIHHHLPPEQMMLMAPPPPPSLMHPPHHLMIQQQPAGIEETSELEHQHGHGPQQQMLEGMQTPKQKGDATTINPYTPANVRVIHLSQLGSAGATNSSTQSTPPYVDVMLHTCDYPHSSPEQQSTSSSSFNTTISPEQPFHLPPYVHMKPLPRNDPLSLLQW